MPVAPITVYAQLSVFLPGQYTALSYIQLVAVQYIYI